MGWIIIIFIGIVVLLFILNASSSRRGKKHASPRAMAVMPPMRSSKEIEIRQSLDLAYTTKQRLTMKYETGNPLPGDPSIKIRDIDIYGDALNLPFKSNCFDTILSTQVLEHVVEPKQMLREAYRVLRAGGYIILTAPMVGELHEVPNDYYRFTIYGLRYLAESVGFEIISIKARCGFWGVIGQELSSYIYNWKGKPKYLVEQAIKRGLATIVQAFYSFLDKIDRKETETLGYIMIAKRVKERKLS